MDFDFLRIGTELLAQFGGPGLMALSFAAATLLPFSSEAALAVAILSGMSPERAVFWASVGNCGACGFNYGLGYWFRNGVEIKIAQSKTYSHWAAVMKRRGIPVLFLSFLPIIGDPITVLSGFLHQRLIIFVPLVFSLRILRYIVLAFGLLP
ncbi:SNARE-like domain protein [Leptospira inadai serovar Lyme str. 10]|uniref:SNARE-like domain protein n=2 Tax=Leptospira inadai serovar Lyme TaxID=293084 RepID=V6H9U9_9LEPT|nr:DedA family protein [Leptospira inadai]EQA36031.1 SNARE-like domain protein [Leptospira inadai serovar Lyme str. 10]PNV76791.1 DedA family protein [Leptospira inadai serovar Lyme]